KTGTFLDFKAEDNVLFLKPEQFIGKKYDELLPPHVGKRFKRSISDSFRKKSTEEIVYTLSVNKNKRNFNARIVPLAEEKVFVFIRDVTEQMQARKKLLSQSNLQTILIKIASDYINVPLSDIETAINSSLAELGKFVQSDRSYIFDYDWYKEVCNNTYEWCQKGISPQIQKLQEVPLSMIPWWVDAHKQGKTMHIPDVFSLDKKDGVRQILEPQEVKSLMTIPMMEKGKCIGFIGFDSVTKHHKYTEKEEILLSIFSEMLVNVKERERLEKNLVEEKRKAEMANNAKSEFLANMSHEIRTPMNAILGFSEALYYRINDNEHKKMLKSVLKSGNLLLSLLNDILDLSKIEADRMELYSQPVDIDTVLNEIRMLFLEKAHKKDVTLSIKVDEAVPKCLILDEIRIKQIIFNLVGNATKFTDKGYININTRFKPSGHNTGDLEIEVRDTGIGIPEDQQEKIFESFHQQSGHSTRKYDGVGLGLAISQRLAEKMGGRIRVKSKVGRGSSFTLTLSDVGLCHIRNIPHDTIDQPVDIVFRDSAVLVVDDVRSNIEVVSSLLKDTKVNVLSAENGEMAFEVLKHTRPDLILLDIRMPGLDGYEVAKRIKKQSGLKDIPIIAFTASVSFRPGIPLPENFAGTLYKPVRKNTLIFELMKYIKYHEVKRKKTREPENVLSSEKLSRELLNNLPEILRQLKEYHLVSWNKVKDSLVLFRIKSFASELKKTGEKYEFHFLTAYASRLIHDVDVIDLDSITENLSSFPNIIEEIQNIRT
ncbi:MAG: ATP-binding protein, partial [Bacteroidota bacterium]